MTCSNTPKSLPTDAFGARELSVIIVNWNSKDVLRTCLTSLFTNDWNGEWEVVVIDNASYDGCSEMLAADFPAVRFVQSEQNLGFARANNVAFGHCSGGHILFLNPDTEMIGTAVPSTLNFLKSKADAGAVGVRLRNSDGTVQTTAIRRFPTLLNETFDFEILRRAFPQCSLWAIAPLFKRESTVATVDAVSGAFLMVTRQAFEQVGGFSANYFMYSEDVDLCYKLHRSGRRNYYLGSATVIHHCGKSTASHEKGYSSVLTRESRHRFFRHYRGRLYAAIYRVLAALTAAVRMGILGLLYLLSVGRFRRAYLKDAFVRWHKSLRWSLGFEAWVGNLGCSAPTQDRGRSASCQPSQGPRVTSRHSHNDSRR